MFVLPCLDRKAWFGLARDGYDLSACDITDEETDVI